MLVGKPPYEAKDVKSTYKRILSNVYSFPESANVSERAKSLIRSMLQSAPEMRPSLNEVANHAFFTASDVRIPLTLPDSCTKEEPKWRIDSKGEIVVVGTSSSSSSAASGKEKEVRAPLGNRDVNARSANVKEVESSVPVKAEGRVTRSRAKKEETTTKPAEAGKENAKEPSQQWAFKIYDDYMGKKDGDKSKKKAEKVDKKVADSEVDSLTARTAAFSLSGGGKSSATADFASSQGSASTPKSKTVDNDMVALETMHQRLSQSFAKGVGESHACDKPADGSVATKWVTRYATHPPTHPHAWERGTPLSARAYLAFARRALAITPLALSPQFPPQHYP